MATAIRKPKQGYQRAESEANSEHPGAKPLSPRVQAKLETLRRKSVRIDKYQGVGK